MRHLYISQHFFYKSLLSILWLTVVRAHLFLALNRLGLLMTDESDIDEEEESHEASGESRAESESVKHYNWYKY